MQLHHIFFYLFGAVNVRLIDAVPKPEIRSSHHINTADNYDWEFFKLDWCRPKNQKISRQIQPRNTMHFIIIRILFTNYHWNWNWIDIIMCNRIYLENRSISKFNFFFKYIYQQLAAWPWKAFQLSRELEIKCILVNKQHSLSSSVLAKPAFYRRCWCWVYRLRLTSNE